jgi:hypothetical protein
MGDRIMLSVGGWDRCGRAAPTEYTPVDEVRLPIKNNVSIRVDANLDPIFTEWSATGTGGLCTSTPGHHQ